jgi:hypothetical protein
MVQFDFDSIQSRIIANLAATTSWANILITGVNANLIASIAQEMAYNMLGNEYYTMENWWGKAQNISSLLVESPVHGYVVPRKTGATGQLQIGVSSTFTTPASANIPLPQFFQFSNGGTTYVCLDNAVTFNAGLSLLSVNVTEGKHVKVAYSAQGIAWETKQIEEANLENFQYVLLVNGTTWTLVNSLYTAGPTDQVYQIIVDPSLTFFTLKFGNGVFGAKLNYNDAIEFDYLSTDGADGNISSLGNITTVVDQAYDSSGNPVKLYVTNTTSLSGGNGYPTIEQVRVNSPLVFQSGDRASNIADYEQIIGALPYIGKVSVWGSVEYNADHNYDPWTFIPLDQNVVHLALLGPGPTYATLTTATQTELIAAVHPLSDPTDLINFENINIVNLVFNSSVFVANAQYALPTVRSAVITKLQDTYGIANMSFDESIHNTELDAVISAVPGVKYHETTVQILQFGSFTSPFVAPLTLPILPINLTTVSIYINTVADPTTWQLLCTFNANGQPTGANNTSTGGTDFSQTGCISTSTSIDPNTGLGNLVYVPSLAVPARVDSFSSISIKIVYSSSDQDILTSSRSEILQFYSANVTTAYATK